MLTLDGHLSGLEALVRQPLTARLYVNEPDGEVVYASDLEEPLQNYTPVTVPPEIWKSDRVNYWVEVKERITFSFIGKAGKIAGYFLTLGDSIVLYEPFMDPIPVNTNEDKIHVRPRIRAKRMAEA